MQMTELILWKIKQPNITIMNHRCKLIARTESLIFKTIYIHIELRRTRNSVTFCLNKLQLKFTFHCCVHCPFGTMLLKRLKFTYNIKHIETIVLLRHPTDNKSLMRSLPSTLYLHFLVSENFK